MRRRRSSQKPFIRIDGGRFIAIIGAEEYVLRPVQDGVRAAIAAALAISRERVRAPSSARAERHAQSFSFTIPIARVCTDLSALVRRLED